MNRKIISEILTGKWFLEPQWAQNHIPLVIALLKGNSPISFVERTGNEGIEQPFIVDPKTMARYNLYNWDSYNERYVPNTNIPPDSVGVIPITGPLTYYNGDCGEPGMMQRTNWLMDFQHRDNIAAIVQLIDTPGGIASAAHNYVAQMNKSNKPILSFVDNCCASLGMWFAAASKETYLAHDLSEMGSIGTFVTLLDFKGYFEKEGIKMVEVYAPQSKDKNKDWRDALNGDTSLIEADLKHITDAFINHVANSRGDKAKANIKEWNSGKMFYAPEAVNVGLADGIRPFSQVVSKAAWLAKRTK